MSEITDQTLVCRQCGKEFIFTQGERLFYERKGLTLPLRCPQCRVNKNNQTQPLVCSHCHTELEKGEALFCTACLATAELEGELKNRELQNSVEDLKSKIEGLESQREEMVETLAIKDKAVSDLQKKVSNFEFDSRSIRELSSSMALMHKSMQEFDSRMGGLEQAQTMINQRMLQLVQKMHEVYDNISLVDLIKRSFKSYPREDPTERITETR